MTEIDSDDLLTPGEAAEIIGITHHTVRTAIYEGRLPHVDIRGKKFVTKLAVEEYKARTQPDGEKPRGRPRKTPAAE